MASRAIERDGVDLDKFRAPDVRYQSARKNTWSVFFNEQVSSHGRHYVVYVDDRTEETRIFQNE